MDIRGATAHVMFPRADLVDELGRNETEAVLHHEAMLS